MIKLAVRKEEGRLPGGGFHYMLHPFAMTSDQETMVFEMMGHVIIEVPSHDAVRLLKEAVAALNHQVQVAFIFEKTLASIQ
jgi:hypothetical protein